MFISVQFLSKGFKKIFFKTVLLKLTIALNSEIALKPKFFHTVRIAQNMFKG